MPVKPEHQSMIFHFKFRNLEGEQKYRISSSKSNLTFAPRNWIIDLPIYLSAFLFVVSAPIAMSSSLTARRVAMASDHPSIPLARNCPCSVIVEARSIQLCDSCKRSKTMIDSMTLTVVSDHPHRRLGAILKMHGFKMCMGIAFRILYPVYTFYKIIKMLEYKINKRLQTSASAKMSSSPPIFE
jgi:hypothetical protein